MAVAPLRRRAGMIEIELKEKKMRDELLARREKEKESVPISEEEHNKRLEMLKSMGVLKE